jgi:putative GTP pyrophosphokinase
MSSSSNDEWLLSRHRSPKGYPMGVSWKQQMAFVEPKYTKTQINRAGHILARAEDFSDADYEWANAVLANWRGCHGYPINTFQATRRKKLELIDPDAIVCTAFETHPLYRQQIATARSMSLARMQDIGGLRAVLGSLSKVRKLETAYRLAKFQHVLVSSKNYIDRPKADGYRSIHLIFRYANDRAAKYKGLLVELQLRTRLQHAWATAVETMGTFLGQALKAGQGDIEWRAFFTTASAALAVWKEHLTCSGF